MELLNINPKEVIFALDIGTRSIIGTVGVVREKKFYCIAESYLEHEERAMQDGQIHDINLVAAGVSSVKVKLEKELNFKLKDVSIAAAGRFLRTTTSRSELKLDYDREIDKEYVRSLELTAVKNAEDEINKNTEGKLYCVGYSVINYFLNDYVISNLLSHKGDNAAVEVIATFLPRSVVESLYAVMEKVGLNVVNLTLEPIAAMEAAVPKSLRLLNIALVDIGAGTSDIAISSKDTISAYGMVSLAGDEVTEAIAQSLLVDFNYAEVIKKELTEKEIINYKDVLGFQNEISSEEIIKIIKPVVDKISSEISSKIIELNGGKAPNAVFLVGGGAHTPLLKDSLSEKLNLPAQRIGIKGRDAVTDCVSCNEELGSTGVTVLGIALVSIMKLGHDFIDVTLNGSVVSLFNSHKHTIADVMMQAGINPKILIAKNGKNIKYNYNGIKRVAFGSLAVNAEIIINEKPGNIDSDVKEGDKIEIIYAKNGMDAAPKVYELINGLNSISLYVNNIITVIDPIVIINNDTRALNETIKDGDEVKVITVSTIGDYKQYIDKDSGRYFINDVELKDSYVINEGDRIYKVKETDNRIENSINTIEMEAEDKMASIKLTAVSDDTKITNQLEVHVNDEKVILKNKEKYIFIDVFDFINFDLTKSRGNLVLILNGKKAGYYDVLSKDDVIKIYWE
ncbi:cell division FtsA domain-containing protein [Candidatus Clostridium radicumherbarum]|uniref:Cell division FtsA domain-containing protein n=1 Tax=Candidatus Clostridium radicumherbarum TaxID=3381662 RepID=A0ABW8TRB1_9CLOT